MRGGSLSGGEENNVTLETDIYERQACDSISDSDFPVGTNESFLFSMAWKDGISIPLPKPVFVRSLLLMAKRGLLERSAFIILVGALSLSLAFIFWSLPPLRPLPWPCSEFTPYQRVNFSPCARHPLRPRGSAYNLRKTFGCCPEAAHASVSATP